MDFEQTLMLGHNLLVCTKWSKLTHIIVRKLLINQVKSWKRSSTWNY